MVLPLGSHLHNHHSPEAGSVKLLSPKIHLSHSSQSNLQSLHRLKVSDALRGLICFSIMSDLASWPPSPAMCPVPSNLMSPHCPLLGEGPHSAASPCSSHIQGPHHQSHLPTGRSPLLETSSPSTGPSCQPWLSWNVTASGRPPLTTSARAHYPCLLSYSNL